MVIDDSDNEDDTPVSTGQLIPKEKEDVARASTSASSRGGGRCVVIPSGEAEEPEDINPEEEDDLNEHEDNEPEDHPETEGGPTWEANPVIEEDDGGGTYDPRVISRRTLLNSEMMLSGRRLPRARR